MNKLLPVWLPELVRSARKSSFLTRWKHWLPKSLRQAGWRIAIEQEVFTVWGSRLYVPADARNRGIILDEYEPAVANKMRELLRPGMTVCDVGANLGVITLLAARLVGASGRVLAFEPVPGNCELLRYNVTLNGYANVSIFQKAVSDQTGVAEIHLSNFCGSHSLLPQPAEATGQILSVETVRLDSFPELQRLDLIKIDTEGAELSVLRSLGIIRPSHILLECNTERLQAGGLSGREFLQALRDLGYDYIKNLDAPSVGLAPIEDGQEGSWNLHASHHPSDVIA